MSIITTPLLQRLWHDTQVHPEWATTRLWKYIFSHMIFNDDKWVVSSHQPPTRQQGELRRVDLMVEKMDNNATVVGTLLFVDVKRTGASPSDIKEVEYQAFTAACAYSVETGREIIWSVTCLGSAARLWIFHKQSTYLIPFVPAGTGLTEKSEYLEISTDGNVLVEGLKFIKENMTPPGDLLEIPPTPRPAQARLPPNWHDSEVQQIDAYRQQSGASVFTA